ncbi:ankyrin repeat domain-containing protein [Kaarinaea lacus]
MRWILIAIGISISGCDHTPTITSNEVGGDLLFNKAAAAIQAGNVTELSDLLEQHPYLANARDSQRSMQGNPMQQPRSLLHVLAEPPAHRVKRTQTADALIRAGCEVNGRLHYSHGETPLHWAASSGDVELIKTLIQHGASVDIDGGSIDRGTPLVNAIYYGHTAAAQILLDNNATIYSFPIAAGLGRADVMQQFIHMGHLQPGAAKRYPNDSINHSLSRSDVVKVYQKAFIYAVFNHQFTIADDLLKLGVNINYQWGNDDYTILHQVAKRGDTDMAKFLVDHGADVTNANNAKNATALNIAQQHNNTRVVNFLRNLRPN